MRKPSHIPGRPNFSLKKLLVPKISLDDRLSHNFPHTLTKQLKSCQRENAINYEHSSYRCLLITHLNAHIFTFGLILTLVVTLLWAPVNGMSTASMSRIMFRSTWWNHRPVSIYGTCFSRISVISQPCLHQSDILRLLLCYLAIGWQKNMNITRPAKQQKYNPEISKKN